jgi:hypothetical protein
MADRIGAFRRSRGSGDRNWHANNRLDEVSIVHGPTILKRMAAVYFYAAPMQAMRNSYTFQAERTIEVRGLFRVYFFG